MTPRKTLISCLVLGLTLSGACAKPEKKVEQKRSGVHVRAPYVSVDVDLPDDDHEDTRVDVDVDD